MQRHERRQLVESFSIRVGVAALAVGKLLVELVVLFVDLGKLAPHQLHNIDVRLASALAEGCEASPQYENGSSEHL